MIHRNSLRRKEKKQTDVAIQCQRSGVGGGERGLDSDVPFCLSLPGEETSRFKRNVLNSKEDLW